MARRFRFNLDPVLRYREIMEDQRRREFAEANRRVEEERLKREEITRERSEMQDEIVRSFESQAPFQSVVTSYHMVGRLEMAAAESVERQKKLEAEREQRRKGMIEARQATKIMESLKERRREEFVREQDRIDQTLLDELSIQARSRRVSEKKAEAKGD